MAIWDLQEPLPSIWSGALGLIRRGESSEGHRLRMRLQAEPGEPGRGFPCERGKGGRRGRGCREQQPSTAGDDTGRMFNQEHGAGKGKAAAACPNLHAPSKRLPGRAKWLLQLRVSVRTRLGLKWKRRGLLLGRQRAGRTPAASSRFWLREMLEVRPPCRSTQPYVEKGEEGVS